MCYLLEIKFTCFICCTNEDFYRDKILVHCINIYVYIFQHCFQNGTKFSFLWLFYRCYYLLNIYEYIRLYNRLQSDTLKKKGHVKIKSTSSNQMQSFKSQILLEFSFLFLFFFKYHFYYNY